MVARNKERLVKVLSQSYLVKKNSLRLFALVTFRSWHAVRIDIVAQINNGRRRSKPGHDLHHAVQSAGEVVHSSVTHQHQLKSNSILLCHCMSC